MSLPLSSVPDLPFRRRILRLVRPSARALAALCATGWILASACTRPEETAELRIGVLADLSSEDGEPTLQGARMAVAEAGELVLGGRPYRVRMVVEDTQDKPEGTARAALRLINEHRVVALIGPSRSFNAIPAGRVAEAVGVPMVSPGSTHPETTADKPFVFRVIFIDPFQGEVMARFAREDLGAGTAAVLFDVSNAYSRDMAAVFRETFEAAGGDVVAYESYTTGDLDFREPLVRIRECRPQVLFLPNYTDDALVQGGQARHLGLAATLLGADGWAAERIVYHPDFDGSFMSTGWHPSAAGTHAESRAFIKAFHRETGREPGRSISALTYDAMGLLLAAARSAGSADPAAIRDALAGTQGYRGVTGTITYRGTEGDPLKAATIITFRDGKVLFEKTIEPPGE